MPDGKQPLTWEELRNLPDRALVYYAQGGERHARVLRWEFPDTELGATACICAWDPATDDETHVLARYYKARFERKQPKIFHRAMPTMDEIVCSKPSMCTPVDWWKWEGPDDA